MSDGPGHPVWLGATSHNVTMNQEDLHVLVVIDGDHARTPSATAIASTLRRASSFVHFYVVSPWHDLPDIEGGNFSVHFCGSDEEISDIEGWEYLMRFRPEIRELAIVDSSSVVLSDLRAIGREMREVCMVAVSSEAEDLGELSRQCKAVKDGDDLMSLPMMPDLLWCDLEKMRSAGLGEALHDPSKDFLLAGLPGLFANVGERVKAADGKWSRQAAAVGGDVSVSDGILRWSGTIAPWSRLPKGAEPPPLAEIWHSERCGWAALARGEWAKPVAWELSPAGNDGESLAQRGWEVHSFGGGRENFSRSEFWGKCSVTIFREAAARGGQPHFVRCGSLAQIQMLARAGIEPPYLAIRGSVGPEVATLLKDLGFVGFARVDRVSHPAGGPVAEGVDFRDSFPVEPIGKGVELHATRLRGEHGATFGS